MKVKLSYRYSELDKEHQFGVTLEENNKEHYQNMYQWLWFYLGAYLGKDRKVRIYPFALDKTLKGYNYNDAKKIAGWICNRIEKKVKNKPKMFRRKA